MQFTLPTDSAVRKEIPLFDGTFGYFPAALVGLARHSWRNNEKHNPGQPMHWSMDKSSDHAECIQRHLLDVKELIAAIERDGDVSRETALKTLGEADALVWRACALSQTLYMKLLASPRPPLGYRGDERP